MKEQLKKTTKAFSKKIRIVSKTNSLFRTEQVVFFLLLFSVILLILLPILNLVIESIWIDGNLSLKGYSDVITSRITYTALKNTFWLCSLVLIGTWIIGGSLAFLCERTDFKMKSSVRYFVFLSFTVPSYILSVSWVEISAKGGYLCRILEGIFKIDYKFNCYSLGAAAIVLIIHLYPLVFWGISNAMRRIDNRLLESAQVCGAGKVKIIFNIILPLILPSIFTTGILVVTRTMANFGVVAQLALPVGVEVITTRIFSSISRSELNLACVYSVILMFISYGLYKIIESISRRGVYRQNSMKNDFHRIKLGKTSTIINVILIVFFSIINIIPILTLVISSFLKRWGLKINMANITIKNYIKIFSGEVEVARALINSLEYGFFAIAGATVIVTLCGYFYLSRNNRLSRVVGGICQLPLTFPNMILAIAAIFAWINEPMKLYGTKWIIIITYMALFIPIMLKQIQGIIYNIDVNRDKCAKTLGINFIYRFSKIFLPEIKRGIIAGGIICFLISLREIPISLLLHAPGTETMGVVLFNIQSNSYGLEMTSTIAVIIVLISIIGNYIVNKVCLGRRWHG